MGPRGAFFFQLGAKFSRGALFCQLKGFGPRGALFCRVLESRTLGILGLFRASASCAVGVDMPRHSSLTAKAISGLSLARKFARAVLARNSDAAWVLSGSGSWSHSLLVGLRPGLERGRESWFRSALAISSSACR